MKRRPMMQCQERNAASKIDGYMTCHTSFEAAKEEVLWNLQQDILDVESITPEKLRQLKRLRVL